MLGRQGQRPSQVTPRPWPKHMQKSIQGSSIQRPSHPAHLAVDCSLHGSSHSRQLQRPSDPFHSAVGFPFHAHTYFSFMQSLVHLPHATQPNSKTSKDIKTKSKITLLWSFHGVNISIPYTPRSLLHLPSPSFPSPCLYLCLQLKHQETQNKTSKPCLK